MKAHEIMKKDVISVMETDNIRFVISKFLQHGISGLPIVNHDGQIVAYISDGDIMRFIGKEKNRVVDFFSFVYIIEGNDEGFESKAKKILDLNVLKIATKKVISVTRDEDIENVVSIFNSQRIKKLPVTEKDKLIGIISRGDV